MESLQDRLQYWMDIRKTNPKRLSKDAGLHSTYIRDVMQRTASPGLDKIAKICRALKIYPHDLVPEIRELYPPEALKLLEKFFKIEEERRNIEAEFGKPE